MQHHPWRTLRDYTHLRLAFADLGDEGPLGQTDGTTITLTTGLLQVERRCVLLHELVHVERGIPHSDDPREEEAVEQEVAHRLIPLDRLVDALRWSRTYEEAAQELWVMPHLVVVRIAHLHPSERAALHRALDEGDDLHGH